MAKDITYDDEVLLKLNKGATRLANAVKSTYGPNGRLVVIGSPGISPLLTKDGIEVARHISLNDSVENMGANLLKEVGNKMEHFVGDGTTCAMIMSQSMLQESIRFIVAGIDRHQLLEALDKAVKEVLTAITAASVPVSYGRQLKQIATTAANGDLVLGEVIAEAFGENQNTLIRIQEWKGVDQEIQFEKGFQVDYGFSSRLYTTNRSEEEQLDNPFILVTDLPIESISDLLPLLEQIAKAGKPLIVFTPSVSEQVLEMILANRHQKSLNAITVQIPMSVERSREIATDLAVISGGKFISRETGDVLRNIRITDLGTVAKAIIDHHRTTLSVQEPSNENTSKLVSALKQQLAAAKDDLIVAQQIKERLSRLSSTLATLYIGGTTETSMHERRYRADDATRAVSSALEEGIITGGGTFFIKYLNSLAASAPLVSTDNAARDILRKALVSPFCVLMENSGKEPQPLIQDLIKTPGQYGYNLKTETIEDLNIAGIVDPARVLKLSLQYAYDFTKLIALSKCAITEGHGNATDQEH